MEPLSHDITRHDDIVQQSLLSKPDYYSILYLQQQNGQAIMCVFFKIMQSQQNRNVETIFV